MWCHQNISAACPSWWLLGPQTPGNPQARAGSPKSPLSRSEATLPACRPFPSSRLSHHFLPSLKPAPVGTASGRGVSSDTRCLRGAAGGHATLTPSWSLRHDVPGPTGTDRGCALLTAVTTAQSGRPPRAREPLAHAAEEVRRAGAAPPSVGASPHPVPTLHGAAWVCACLSAPREQSATGPES